jgi:hypothetical protein
VNMFSPRRHEEHEVGNFNFRNLRMLRTTMFENPRNLGKSCRRAIADPPPQGVCYTPLHSEYLSDCVLRSLRPLRLNHPIANLLPLRLCRHVLLVVHNTIEP